jgi:glycosyltransferase involved in cell wall biosynthesis
MISIVVSAFNVEKYVEKSINSILNQTYSDIELIIVEDCSVD